MADAQDDATRLSTITQALTTEHFALQSARGSIATESVGRATMYLGTVSSALIAMGFLAQLLKLDPMFMLISLVLLATLFMLGVVTCVRLVQLGIDDMSYQHAINRLRHWYLEVGPEMRPYFLMSDRDDLDGVLRNLTMTRSGWQLVFSMTGAISLINSLLGAVAVALAMHTFAGVAVGRGVVGGAVFGAISAIVHAQVQARMWKRAEQRMPVMFPSPASAEASLKNAP